ncbi:hypothetical protein ACFWGN_17185 [Oerskovia sp. NPDC060338]|uniref:hypothetical protein n=1 Tax=Oerskovia sp. NPDC060338 TaxID=3347100 RepID=UPI0036475720
MAVADGSRRADRLDADGFTALLTELDSGLDEEDPAGPITGLEARRETVSQAPSPVHLHCPS